MTEIAASPRTILAVGAALGRARLFDDKLGGADEGRIAAWSEVIDQYDLDESDLLAGVTSYYSTNREGRVMQVADLVRHARAIRCDRDERSAPREIEPAHDPGEEHYPGDAKAAPDPADYPAHWDTEQRLAAYWFAVNMHAIPHTTAGWEAIAKQIERKRADRAQGKLT